MTDVEEGKSRMTSQRLRVEVDEKVCVGSRLCQMAAPEVFVVRDGDGYATVLQPEAEGVEEVWDAIEGCPREAIRAHDAQTGEQLFP
jgi:ferredoxin